MKISLHQILDHNGYKLGANKSIRSKILAEYIAEMPQDVLEQAVKSSNTRPELLQKLKKLGVPSGKLGTSGNFSYIQPILDGLGIDYSHFKMRNRSVRKKYNTKKIGDDMLPDEVIEAYFSENPVQNLSWASLLTLIRDHNLLGEKCSECGISSKWNGKPLRLHVDHINGVRHDNRIENLRHLCPNCHTQTGTFGSKNKKNRTNMVAETVKKV